MSILIFFVFAFFPLILKYFAPFPLDKIQFSSDTSVFCENPIYPMGCVGIYDQEYFDLKTDFIGYIRNDHRLKAKNVKLAVIIHGISNPRSKWTMGTVVIDEIPPKTTKKFNVKFDHDCAQADINWTYEVMEAYYL